MATLKSSLENPDYGLDHANTNNIIARHYMGQKKFAEALPYAETAAESYAGWAGDGGGLPQALGHREKAAAIRAAIAERYGK